MRLPAKKIFGWIGALLAVVAALYVGHQIGKMPEDPSLAPLPDMYQNFAFVMALGLGLPWPGISSLFVLLLIAWLGYITGSRLGAAIIKNHN